MALRRRLLGLLSIVSLAILVYAGVSIAFSVTVDDLSATSNARATGGPAAGSRAVVVPLVDAAIVPTFADGRDGPFGHDGAYIARGVASTFPIRADNVSLVRALVLARPLENLTYEPEFVTLRDVPHLDENGTETLTNLTLNITEFALGRVGFIVKADNSTDISFVPLTEVVGQVIRFDPAGRTVLTLIAAAVGFVAPVMGLIATHKAPTRAGTGQAICRECQALVAAKTDFCTRCGAWRETREA